MQQRIDRSAASMPACCNRASNAVLHLPRTVKLNGTALAPVTNARANLEGL
jgi:hypothetical protein